MIVASAAPPTFATKKATTSVPIVFVGVNFPVEIGLIQSLPHPGGNLTGLALNAAAIAGKHLDFNPRGSSW